MLNSTLHGTALQNAEIAIARYCLKLKDITGVIDIEYIVTTLNTEYRLVADNFLSSLIFDIRNAFTYLESQQLTEMSRAGYWKFKAQHLVGIKSELEKEISLAFALSN